MILGIILLIVLSIVVVFSIFLKNYRRDSKVFAIVNGSHKNENSAKNSKVCFIINPSKNHVKEARQTITDVCNEEGVEEFYFKETTIEHPGNQQAIEALEEGADLIVACGGDGTVRSVACGLAKYEGSDEMCARRDDVLQMGIIPLGTGNVLAHNLELPLDDVSAATRVALFSPAHSFDVGLCSNEQSEDGGNGFEHAFMVIAGVGYDANMVQATNPKAKKVIGPLAYYVAGVKEAFKKKAVFNIEIVRPDGSIIKTSSKLRTVMVGNVGRIPGFNLIPDAEYNDGVLDVVAIDTSGGPLGWAQLGGEILMQNFGVSNDSKYKLGRIEQIQATQVKVTLSKSQESQLDGDLIGRSRYFTFRCIKGGVKIRFPKIS